MRQYLEKSKNKKNKKLKKKPNKFTVEEHNEGLKKISECTPFNLNSYIKAIEIMYRNDFKYA